jgi:hypothetical protein
VRCLEARGTALSLWQGTSASNRVIRLDAASAKRATERLSISRRNIAALLTTEKSSGRELTVK